MPPSNHAANNLSDHAGYPMAYVATWQFAFKLAGIRVGLGGDLVMITPALNGLLAAFPRAEFHLLTSSEG